MSGRWTKKEVFILKVAYELGANYAMMQELLNKTYTAINKQLTRSGIRPLGSARRGKKTLALSLITTDELKAEIRLRMGNSYDCTQTESSLMPVSQKKPMFLRSSPKKVDNYDDIEICDDLQKPVNYLSSMGYNVKKVGLSWGEYLVNSKICTGSQLLIMANKIRCEHNMSPFVLSEKIYKN